MFLTVIGSSFYIVSLGRPVSNLPKLRLLLRIRLSKFNLRRMIWFLVNGFLLITFIPLSLVGCIIQRDTLMLRICFMVVVYLWIVHPGRSRFGIKLHSVPMRTLSISCSTNAMRPTMVFEFMRTILIMVCSLLRIYGCIHLKGPTHTLQ